MGGLGELDLSGISAAEERQILDRLLRDDFDAWAEQAARVDHWAHPIRLTGQQQPVEAATGSVLFTFASASLPARSFTCDATTVGRRGARPAPGLTRATYGTCSGPARLAGTKVCP